MFILQHKLKRLKIKLRNWNKISFDNVYCAVILQQNLLISIQQNLEIVNLSDINGLLCKKNIAKEEFNHVFQC